MTRETVSQRNEQKSLYKKQLIYAFVGNEASIIKDISLFLKYLERSDRLNEAYKQR